MILVLFIFFAKFLGVVATYRMYLLWVANFNNNNFGNILDRMCALYLYCQGNEQKIRSIKNKIYYNSRNYKDDIYLNSSLTPKDCFKLSFLEKMKIFKMVHFPTACLWHDNKLICKSLCIPYARECIQRRSCLLQTSITLPQNIICIHFRCSDIPFNRLELYNLYNCKWYKAALELAFKLHPGIEEIRIVSSNTHTDPKGVLHVPRDKMARQTLQCKFFIEQYHDYIRSLYPNIPITFQCESLEKDIAMLANCKVLVATTGSLAFWIGYSSPNTFITANTHDQNAARPGMYVLPGGKILHKNVKDYFDQHEMARHLAGGDSPGKA